MQLLTIVIVMLIATLGPALVIGVVGYVAVKALCRHPSASPRIFVAMMVAFIFAEGIAIIAILTVMNRCR